LDQLQLNPCISASFTKQSLVSNLINLVLNWLFKFLILSKLPLEK
jgi:hypothetical protein